MNAFCFRQESAKQGTKGTYVRPVMKNIHEPAKTNAANALMKRSTRPESQASSSQSYSLS